ncbi:sigma-54 interaction domain-containing protein [Neobacillus vireti]|uniref:sigma-54 interaction domain-containing protein n=1 Tax=Neobacillus vireti TaxID=220686 RepID=UPI002FFF9BD4
MPQFKDMMESITRFKSIGVLITDEEFCIQNINDTAMKLYTREQLEEIIFLYPNSSNNFCNCKIKCEIEVIKQGSSYIFLLQSKKEIFNLYQKIEKIFQDNNDIKHILDSSFDGIAITDANGVLLYENQALEQFIGIRVKEIIGKNVHDIIAQGIVDNSITVKILKGKKPVSMIQNYPNTGKKLLITGVPIKDKNGQIKRIVINTRDLTILNNLEKEIQDLKSKNQRMKLYNEELTLKENARKSLVAKDKKIKEVIDRALRVAQTDSTVLIQGESGSGKEGIVNLIHQSSYRKDNPLVKINCGAIPDQLLESELFGYESGAFSGASQKGKPGLFEIASEGTIFLDEIGEMPLQLQVKLLRVLQEFEITRIGGVKPIKVDVRIITATHRNLEEMVAKGNFREDLYYRLKIIPITVPPLRERKEDVIPLVYHFLNQIRIKYGINTMFSQEALAALQNYSWPGNVRELQNLVERVALMVNKTIIDITDINHEYENRLLQGSKNFSKKEKKVENKEITPLKVQMEECEKEIIHYTLRQFPSIRRAAQALGIDSSTLVRKKQKYLL